MRRSAALVPRLVASLVLGAAALISGAATSMAATPETLWVDGDGTVGAADCSGTLEAFTTIQLAIEIAGRGDTIKVCPGTYTERLEIIDRTKKGLTLVSVVRHGAVIQSQPGLPGAAVIRIESNRVTLDGFRVVLRPAYQCGPSVAVYVRVTTRTSLRDLRLEATEGNPEFGPYCRYTGVYGTAGDRLLIDGVQVTGYSSGIEVRGVPVITDTNVVPKDEDTDGPSSVCHGFGIFMVGDSPDEPAIVRDTTVTQGTADTNEQHLPACNGITTHGFAWVDGNTVSGTWVGIRVSGKGLVENNVVSDVVGGIEMMARGEVRFNRISGATSFGLETTLARARVHDNDVRGNEGTDCVDGTVARRTGWPENFGTANRWTNNRGDDATPAGICTPAAS